MNIRKKLEVFYREYVSLRGEPGPIASGMAMGIFIGVTPTIPFHTILIVMFGILFRQNITSACLGSWLISNPLTIPVFYVIEYQLGKFLLGDAYTPLILGDYTIWTIAEKGWNIILPLLTGGFIIAPLFAIPAYFITYRIIANIRAKHRP